MLVPSRVLPANSAGDLFLGVGDPFKGHFESLDTDVLNFKSPKFCKNPSGHWMKTKGFLL